MAVENGETTILTSLDLLTSDDFPRNTSAFAIQIRQGRCAAAWGLVSAVLGAPNERAAIRDSGFKLRSVRDFSDLSPPVAQGSTYQVVATRGRATVRYVRFGRGLATGAFPREPIEGLWYSENSRAAIVVERFFLAFQGTIVTEDPDAACPLGVGQRPWFIEGSGRSYTGTAPWLERLTCQSAGQASASWTVSPDGRRLRACSAPPYGLGLPQLDENGDPIGDTECSTWIRLGAGAVAGARRVCFRYQVIGVRGSGEALAGPFDMGETVGRTAGATRAELDNRSVGLFSLPYPAAPVSDLLRDLGRPFFDSISQGVELLTTYIIDLRGRCPRTKVALIGYSQGAAVVSQAARALPRSAREQVRAIVLFADPYSAGASDYAVTPSLFPDGMPRRNGAGGLGSRRAALPGRTTDVCFANDVVCDVPGGLSLATVYEGLSSKVHSRYKSCCRYGRFDASLTRSFGSEAGRRLRR